MLPKAFKLGRKGFTISPFFLIAMVLLGALLISHFQQTDQSKQKQIMDAGEKNKQYLEVEEGAAKLQTLLMFVSNQAVYEENEDLQKIITLAQASNADLTTVLGSDAIKSRLEKKISAALNKESKTTFTVKIDASKPEEGFTVTASGGQLDSPNGKIPVTLEKFINARIFLLASKLLDLRTNFMQPLADKLSCKFNKNSYTMSASCQPATLQLVNSKVSAPGVYCNIIAKPNPTRANYPNYDIQPDLKTPDGAMKRILLALDESIVGIAVESNKNKDDIASSYQIKEVTTTINPVFTAFEDPLADDEKALRRFDYKKHCCDRRWTPTVRDEHGKIITPTKPYCNDPDEDYSGYIDIKAEIKIQAKYSDHAKIADDKGGNYKICTTSPIMINTGKVVPLELSHEFTVPVVIRISNLFQECQSSQPKAPFSATRISGFPVYTIDSTNSKFTPDLVTCGTSIRVRSSGCPYTLIADKTCRCGA